VILSWVYWLKGMRPGDEKPVSGETAADTGEDAAGAIAASDVIDVGGPSDPVDGLA
jgi:hypothetical protein